MTRKYPFLQMAGAFGAALLFLVSVQAQPPGGRRGPGDRGKDAPRTNPAKADPALDAWIKVLAEKVVDKNDSVRTSARAALVAIGQPALPALKKIAEGNDEAAIAAKRMIAQIDASTGRGFGQRGGNRGFPGAGPGGAGGFGRFGGSLFDRLNRELDLTGKQKDKVQDIVTAHEKKAREALEKAREGGRPDFEKMREASRTVREDLVKELKGVLTAEQMKKVEATLEGGFGNSGGFNRGGRGERGGRGSGVPETPRTPETPPKADAAAALLIAPALKTLELTEKQKTRVADIAAKHDKQVRAIFEKATDAKQRPDFAALGTLLADSMKELKGILTDEQFKKLEKAMTQPGPGGSGSGVPARRKEF